MNPLSEDDRNPKLVRTFSDDLDGDYNTSRATFYQLLEWGNMALPKLVELAAESEHPRAYEVLFKALRDMGDTADKLMELHRRTQMIESESRGQISRKLESEQTPQRLEYSTNEILDATLEEIDDQ